MNDFDIKMTTLAENIREKAGVSGSLSLDEMANAVEGISIGIDTSDATAAAEEIFAGKTAYVDGEKLTGNFTIENEITEQTELISQIVTLASTKATPQGGTDTNDATATASDILSGKTAYVKGEKVTGNIATKTSSNLTASGATVTVPAGYYASQATKSVSSGSAKTPATTVTKNPSISVSSSGLITASVSGTQSVTPTVSAGYVSSGTAGTITVSGSATKQLTTQAAQTITPGTSNKTIASGRYLTGTQTIKGDSNLVAGNIKKGTSIFGVTGTYEGSGGSGGGASCTVTVTTGKLFIDGPLDFYYTSPSGEAKMITTESGSFTVLKNSIVAMPGGCSSFHSFSSTAEFIYKQYMSGSFRVTGDCTITLNS